MIFRRALVTGATSGIGAAIAQLLQDKGIETMRVGSTDADLATGVGQEKLTKWIADERPDLVINSAGLGFYGPAIEGPLEDQQRMVEVNCQALLALTLAAAKALLNAGEKGVIVNVSSAGAHYVMPYFTTYAASKAFVNSFSQGLDEELREHGIRVLTCCPGQVKTSFQKRAARGKPQEKGRRTISPEFVAEEIWRQIEGGQQIRTIDWRYRWLRRLHAFLPQSFVRKRIRATIERRYNEKIH